MIEVEIPNKMELLGPRLEECAHQSWAEPQNVYLAQIH